LVTPSPLTSLLLLVLVGVVEVRVNLGAEVVEVLEVIVHLLVNLYR
jgi:hypothetical protein